MPYKPRPILEEPELLGGLSAGTSQQLPPPVPMAPPPPAPSAPVTPMQQTLTLPPAQKPAPAPAPVMSKPLPGMPPSVSMDELEGYLGRQKQGLDKFGADAQMNLQNETNARRNSLGYKVKDAGKGFADAIMMGVARAGNPGWQNQFEGQENQIAQEKMNTLRGASDANLKSIEGGMSLDRMDPNSELSKAAQASYAPLFQKLGYPAGGLKNMSAADIDTRLSLMTQFGGQEVEAQIKQAELESERMRMAVAVGKQQSDEGIAKNKAKADAAADLLRSDTKPAIYNPLSWFSGLSDEQRKSAENVLAGQMGEGVKSEGESTETTKEPPLGQTTIRNGVEYEWSPVSGKYHRKQ